MFRQGFFLYLLVMAGVTYLLRMLPMALLKKKIENRYLLSFLYYVPYAVLSAMTFPACLYATGNVYTALAGTLTALVLSFFRLNLTVVAAGASGAALLTHLLLTYVIAF